MAKYYTREAIKEYVGTNIVLITTFDDVTYKGHLITFNDGVTYELLPLIPGEGILELKRSHIKQIKHLNGVIIPKEIKENGSLL